MHAAACFEAVDGLKAMKIRHLTMIFCMIFCKILASNNKKISKQTTQEAAWYSICQRDQRQQLGLCAERWIKKNT